MDAKRIKIIAFDLDGTLTQHKQPMVEENKKALEKLNEKRKAQIKQKKADKKAAKAALKAAKKDNTQQKKD